MPTAETYMRNACLIGGEWMTADSGAQISVNNPATGEIIGHVPRCGRVETRRAIAAASEALSAWRARTAEDRANAMMRLHDAILANRTELARLLTLEMGKPLAESQGEIAFGAKFFRWFAEEGRRVYGDTIPGPAPHKRLIVTKEPVGVVGAITPWNFPNSMIARKLAAAMAAGCTAVIKPASQTPYSALAIGVLAQEAEIPAGVVNVVTGSAAEIAEEMCNNPSLRKISFTGSTPVGKKLASAAGAQMKRVSMELGGNAPFIVFEDADLDAAVDGAMVAKFRNTGQTCVCTNRFIVHANVYDAFGQKLAQRMRALKIGAGMTSDVDQGPLIDEAAVQKVEEHIRDAVDKGAKVVEGGQRHALGGLFFQPTLLTDVTSQMVVARDETFGPLAPMFRFHTDAEAISMANDTEYGLAAYFYTRDLRRTWHVMEQLEYGLIGVNDGLVSTEVAPFGGFKDSGMGKEGSKYGLDDYLNVKYTCINVG